MFIYGFLAVLPKIIVSYVVGLGIEFVVAQWKKEEIQESVDKHFDEAASSTCMGEMLVTYVVHTEQQRRY